MRITHTSKKFSRNFSKVRNQTHTLLYKPVFWWSIPDNLIESPHDSRHADVFRNFISNQDTRKAQTVFTTA